MRGVERLVGGEGVADDGAVDLVEEAAAAGSAGDKVEGARLGVHDHLDSFGVVAGK